MFLRVCEECERGPHMHDAWQRRHVSNLFHGRKKSADTWNKKDKWSKTHEDDNGVKTRWRAADLLHDRRYEAPQTSASPVNH